jgi:hypothetical protein
MSRAPRPRHRACARRSWPTRRLLVRHVRHARLLLVMLHGLRAHVLLDRGSAAAARRRHVLSLGGCRARCGIGRGSHQPERESGNKYDFRHFNSPVDICPLQPTRPQHPSRFLCRSQLCRRPRRGAAHSAHRNRACPMSAGRLNPALPTLSCAARRATGTRLARPVKGSAQRRTFMTGNRGTTRRGAPKSARVHAVSCRCATASGRYERQPA